MELLIELLDGAVTKASPVGRWDIVGAAEIDLKLSALAGSGRSLIIDLGQVSFLSSMGLRSIVMSAKAISVRGARMVLLSPNAHVAEVLSTTGIDTLVSVHQDIEAARSAVMGG